MPSTNSVMTPFPYVVQVDDSLLYAREVMVRHRVRHLPVKNGAVLAGVLSDRDLKRAFDPDLGLPPKDELFVRDVFQPDAYIVESAAAGQRARSHGQRTYRKRPGHQTRPSRGHLHGDGRVPRVLLASAIDISRTLE